MEDGHGDELVTDLTNSLEPNSQTISDQGMTSELKAGKNEEVDLPQASGKAFIGELLYGRYRIISLIAKGGMGEVYKAKIEATDKLVAVKVLSQQLAKRKESLYRFMREISSVAALKHPNLISVSDIGLLDNGCPYYVMEFVEGKSLADILLAEGHLEIDKAKSILAQLSGALAAAHERGFVHRDIKPSNILVRVGENNEVDIKLVDFGITKRGNENEDTQRLTSKGTVFGSPLYMSPEQCEGKATDARTDVYSACCTIYECLKGIPPFRGETPLQTMSMHKNDVVAPLNLSGEQGVELEALIMKGLQKDPTDRFNDGKEMLDCLLSRTNIQEKEPEKIALDSAADLQPEVIEKPAPSAPLVDLSDNSNAPAKNAFWLSPAGLFVFVLIVIVSAGIFMIILNHVFKVN